MLMDDYLVVKIIIIAHLFVAPRAVIIACKARKKK